MTNLDSSYCDLHGWNELGAVDTDVATLAIVAPHMAGTLGDRWQERIPEMHAHPLSIYEDWELRQTTYSVGCPGGYPDISNALLFNTPMNGHYRVFGRFHDPYGDGHLELAEVLILLGDDEEVEP